MSNTFEELRADLARFVGMFRTGSVDSGSNVVITDLGGLATITEPNALNGGLLYIRAAGAAAPENESRWIEDYIEPGPSGATELVSNGGFETAGAGGADVFADWTETVGDGAMATDTNYFVGGTKSCKLTAGANANTVLVQYFAVLPNTAYKLVVYHWADEAGSKAEVHDWEVGEELLSETFSAETTFHELEKMFVTPDGCVLIRVRLTCATVAAGIVYYDDVSVQLGHGIHLAEDLSVAAEDGDTYEIYLAPLALAQWDQAINDAIQAAWPQVFSRELWDTPSREVSEYLLPDDVEGVLEVAVAFRGQYAGEPTQTIPRHLWRVEGTPGTDLNLQLHRIVPAAGRDLHIYYKAKYAELAAGESSDIDHEYVMLAAAAKLYHMLAAEAGPQAASARYLQLLNYYDKEAKERRDLLEADLLSLPIEARRERGSRKK